MSSELIVCVEIDLLPAMMHELCVNFIGQVGIGLVPISNACGIVVVVGTGLMGSCGVRSTVGKQRCGYSILE